MKIKFLALFCLISLLCAGYFGLKIYRTKQSEKRLLAEMEQQQAKGKQEQAQYLTFQKNQDMDLCNKQASEAAMKCVGQVLSKYSSTSIELCEKLVDPKLKKFCQDILNLDNIVKNQKAADCRGLGEQFISTCVDSISMQYKDATECATMMPEDKQRCLDLVSYKNAINSTSSIACSDVKSDTLATDCLQITKNKPVDSDNDGVSNQVERSLGLDPGKADSDEDGLTDGEEINNYITNPSLKDTDNDSLSDKNEIFLGTNPTKIDTDNDGYSDGAEISKSFNPCGDGDLPSNENLKKQCQQFKK